MSNDLVISSSQQTENIKEAIYEIRGQKVMLDYDLAAIYGVKTATLNQAVKRNIDRFPDDFMFRITEEEWELLLNSDMISQFVTSSLSKRKKTAPPYAFTEHGAVMLAAVLRSPSAVQMSVVVTRAFIAMRQAITTMLSVDLKVEQISHKVDQLNAYVEELLHDQNDINDQQEQTNNEVALQIEAINNALDQLRDEKAKPRKPIGFKTNK
ncbi:MAG: ORF6N domain-containing protein [Bacteroidales bacterium]|nr:ORF6N domain-containing protein [Bacteroidales bacterium]